MTPIICDINNCLLPNSNVWIIRIPNNFNSHFTLLLSKFSEAISPNTLDNSIGEGTTFQKFLQIQPNVRFIINGGFNHYRKNFYEWPHQNFNIGDPVGITKIRQHYYEDFLDIEDYGFFVQEDKNQPWKIIQLKNLNKTYKYILGCTPLLILNSQPYLLDEKKMIALDKNTINPPSFLGHGLQSHPRTAVGIKDNEIFFIVIQSDTGEEGATLLELQKIGIQLKLDSLLNLDGGGSSQFLLWNPQSKSWIGNPVSNKDKDRVLGHAIVLFEENKKDT